MFQRVGVLEQAAVVQEQVQREVQRLREGGPGGRAGQHRQHRQVGPLLHTRLQLRTGEGARIKCSYLISKIEILLLLLWDLS